MIGYWARVRWGRLRFGYAGVLRSRRQSPTVAEASTLRCGAEPVAAASGVAWACPALRLQGDWTTTCPPAAERTLLVTEHGIVRWTCASPRATCSLRVGAEEYAGLGYAEVLEMTIPPWRLPVRELRWGRWLTDAEALTWIDWRGPHPLSLVLDRGHEVAASVDDDGVSMRDGRRLSLQLDRVIRSGSLGATVVRAVPGLRGVLPRSIARTREHKWLSCGVTTPNGSRGWAIHERVEFGA